MDQPYVFLNCLSHYIGSANLILLHCLHIEQPVKLNLSTMPAHTTGVCPLTLSWHKTEPAEFNPHRTIS